MLRAGVGVGMARVRDFSEQIDDLRTEWSSVLAKLILSLFV